MIIYSLHSKQETLQTFIKNYIHSGGMRGGVVRVEWKGNGGEKVAAIPTNSEQTRSIVKNKGEQLSI